MTDELERRIRQGLHGADLPPAPQTLQAALDNLPTEAGPIATGSLRPVTGRLLLAVTSVVVAALLAVWLVPGHLLGPASPSPSAGASSSPTSGVPSPGPSLPAASAGTLTWTSVTLPLGRAAAPGEPYAWGAFAGGYLLAGCPTGGTGSIVWYSADGLTWQQDDTSGQTFGMDSVESFIATPSGVLAVGTTMHPNASCMGAQPTETLAAVMWSSMDGRTWQRLSDAQLAVFAGATVDLVTAGPGGLIAFGYDNVVGSGGPAPIREWHSQDGVTWTASAQFGTAFPDACTDSIAPLGHGFVAAGRTGCYESSGPGAQQRAAWYSGDGQSWTEAKVPSSTTQNPDYPASTTITMAGSAAGAVALVGPFGASTARDLWTTTDGQTWVVRPPASIPFEDGQGASTFIGDQTRILALSQKQVLNGTPEVSTAWSSPDGVAWQPVNEVGVPSGEFFRPTEDFPTSGALGPNGVLVVTYDLAGSGFHVWFGAWTASPVQPVPSPSVSSTVTPSASDTATALGFFNAQTGLLVGSDGSGTGAVWRTSDGGRTWSAPIALPRAQPTSVAVWGTQDAWIGLDCRVGDTACQPGVLASSDGGVTWRRVSGTDVVSIGFADATHGWATLPNEATTGGLPGGLVATADGGRTWSAAVDHCPAAFGWPAAVSFPGGADGWLGCTGLSGAGTAPKWVFGTTDGGRTWTTLAAATVPGFGSPTGSIDIGDTLAGIAMRPEGAGLWWGERGETERTTDGGRTWTVGPPGEVAVVIPGSIALPTDVDWFALLWDGNAGQEVVEVSHDGGRTWITASSVPAGTVTP